MVYGGNRMCGIAGKIYFDKQKKVEADLLSRMTGLLAHRGPDDQGISINKNVGLGFRRLSIIDLSMAAHQPMANEDATIWLVFNGEIYNFIDLRIDLEKKGHRFRSSCDSEVAIHSYEEYGPDCVTRFNGMFALAIWDQRKEQLFCARDRTGEKPFFYYIDNQKFVFASELKSILADNSIRREIDPEALNAYFSYMYIPAPYSIFKGIRKLPAGHTLVYRSGEIKTARYWDLYYPHHKIKRENEYIEELRSLLTDAVKIRMVSDVPLGIFLSGGIDSSAVTALACRILKEPVKTFSVSGGIGIFNELPFARIVANEFDTNHFEFNATPENIETLLPKLIRFIDEPFADSSIIPTYYVSKMAKQNVTVALSGEGGDEIFGGYPWYKRNLLVRRFEKLLPSAGARRLLKKAMAGISSIPDAEDNYLFRYLKKVDRVNSLSLLSAGKRYQSIRTLFENGLKRKILKEDSLPSENNSLVNEAYRNSGAGNCLDRALYADLKTYLPGDLLTKVDRMSMANSLEVRTPFLDHRIIEFGSRTPAYLKIRNGLTKYILRKAMDKIVPRKILQRREKRGFCVPVQKWFRGELKGFAAEILLDRTTLRRGIFLEEGIKEMLSLHQQGREQFGHHIWTLLLFELWAREYL